MPSVTTNGYVSVSEFSRGNTARIFKELKSEKEIIVLKNNKPIGILVLPENHILEKAIDTSTV